MREISILGCIKSILNWIQLSAWCFIVTRVVIRQFPDPLSHSLKLREKLPCQFGNVIKNKINLGHFERINSWCGRLEVWCPEVTALHMQVLVISLPTPPTPCDAVTVTKPSCIKLFYSCTVQKCHAPYIELPSRTERKSLQIISITPWLGTMKPVLFQLAYGITGS